MNTAQRRWILTFLLMIAALEILNGQTPPVPRTVDAIPIKLVGADTTPVWLDTAGTDTVTLAQARTLLGSRKAIAQALQQLPVLEARVKELLSDSITARQYELDIRNGLWVRTADAQKAIAEARAADLAAFETANPGKTLQAGKVVAK